MNSGVTSERVYATLKRQLLDGDFRPGDRLDPALLSESLGSSVTPVRDALNILTGEQLVATRTGEGYYLPHITVPDLQDLYQWNEQVALLAVRHWPRPDTIDPLAVAPDAADAERARDLFLALASRSPNIEHRRTIAALNDRLHVARMHEPGAIAGCDIELDELADAVTRWSAKDAARRLTGYHRRRRRVASEIVRSVYRDR